MSAVACADEHEPALWVVALLQAIADMAADGRRGVFIDDGAVFQVSVPTDSGADLVLTLTTSYDFKG